MIKVLIERQIASELAEHYHKVARDTLRAAMQWHGFISGESMKDVHNPNHRVVIASYRTPSDWSSWYHSDERKAMMETLAPMLTEEEEITLLEHL
jgi:antibiotic biosynthesis monooxygenase (ABM) superfamily enzyme